MKIQSTRFIVLVAVLGLVTLACGITATATPDPNVPITMANVCDYDNQVVELEGQLVLPNIVNCSTEAPITCEIYFHDPLNNQGFNIEIPSIADSGELPVNSMADLPDPFDSSDFYIRTGNDIYVGDRDLVSIKGTVDSSGFNCTLSPIESITGLDHLVYAGLDLTRVTLQEAMADGLVVASFSGDGLTKVTLKVKPTVELNLEIEIIPGTILISGTEGVQNMVVRQQQMVYLKPEIEVGIELEAACINMELDQPTFSDGFTISSEPADGDLAKLLALDGFRFESTELQQFAIWTITSNPYNLFGYVGIDSGNDYWAMTELFVNVIKVIFEEAGIDTSNYWIFNPNR